MVTKRSFKAALWTISVGAAANLIGAFLILPTFQGQAFSLPLAATICLAGAGSIAYGVCKLIQLARYKKEKRRRYAPCPCCGSDFCCESDRCCSYCGENLR